MEQTTNYGWIEFKYLSLVVIGIVGFQVLMTLAFTKEKAARVAPIGAFQLILNFGFDFFILNKGVGIRINEVLGGLMIFLSNLTVGILKCQNVI